MEPDALFDLDPPESIGSATSEMPQTGYRARPVKASKAENEGKRSIQYLMEVALRFGKLGGTDLLDRVATFPNYKPYNALLVLLQRPAATLVLPAHAWEERFGWVVRPDEQPLVLLANHGPVMFLFDVSQVEPGHNARELPQYLRNPYAMAAPLTRANGWLVRPRMQRTTGCACCQPGWALISPDV